jgi:hypothetical protein
MRTAHTTRTCGPRAAQPCAAARAPRGAPGAHTALGVCDPPAPPGPPAGAPAGGRGPGIRGGGGMSAAAVRGAAPARAGAGTHGTLSVLRKKLSTAATASPSPACARARRASARGSRPHATRRGRRLQDRRVPAGCRGCCARSARHSSSRCQGVRLQFSREVRSEAKVPRQAIRPVNRLHCTYHDILAPPHTHARSMWRDTGALHARLCGCRMQRGGAVGERLANARLGRLAHASPQVVLWRLRRRNQACHERS